MSRQRIPKDAHASLRIIEEVWSADSGTTFRHGEPVEFPYTRNTRPSPHFGETYQQHIEPAGRYLIAIKRPDNEAYVERMQAEGWEYGICRFQKPLVIAFTCNPDEYYGEASWKAALEKHYGKRGKALSRALLKEGYDGIVTVWMQDGKPAYVKEVVDLTVVARTLKRGRDNAPSL